MQQRAPLAIALLWVGVVALVAAVSACSTPEPGAADAAKATTDAGGRATPDAPLATTDVAAELPAGAICTPGTTKGCESETHVLRCTDDGAGYAAILCTDDTGAATGCLNPGVCTNCPVNLTRCSPKDSTVVEICNAAGKWDKKSTCNAQQGEICTAGGLCQRACDYHVKRKSYVGCSFWAVDLDNAFVPGGKRQYYDAAGAQYSVVVSNASDKLSSTIKVENNEGEVTLDAQLNPLDVSPLGAGDLRVFNLQRRDADATGIKAVAYRIDTSAPIAAYQFNPLENVNVYSNDASLLLPSEALGTWYIVMTREQSFSILRGFVTVAATVDGITNVTVTFSKTSGTTLPSSDGKIKAFKAGESAQFQLKKWDVLNIETNEVGSDLTGTVVLADNKVAVFSGSEAANVPNTNHCLRDKCKPGEAEKGIKCGACEWDPKTACSNNEHCGAFITCCADHLEMQMFPVTTWASHYVGVKLFPRGQEADSWRILAAGDGTKIALVPPQKDPKGHAINPPVLDAGEWYEFESKNSFEIIAKKDDGAPAPILVGHFMSSQDAPDPNVSGTQQGDAGTGDPAFLLAIPTEQWREDYVFLTPNKYAFNYISIAAPVDAEVVVDGAVVAPDLWTGISKDFKFTRMLLQSGTHNVTSKRMKNEPRPVAVDVYGFDQYVSYGYPAGLDLKTLDLIKQPGQ
ncbi:MAG: hypothetical protein EXR79_03930 [Myxococcales bacterium]|nr:hypothetical protein [Myxococcales bacterium]